MSEDAIRWERLLHKKDFPHYDIVITGSFTNGNPDCYREECSALTDVCKFELTKEKMMSVIRATKKPVSIEAFHYTDHAQINEIQKWMGLPSSLIDTQSLIIPTLEGHMHASLGDWIIKGVKNEFYPCKPDIFDLTYDY